MEDKNSTIRLTEKIQFTYPKNRLFDLYQRAPDIFYQTLSSLPDSGILTICQLEEFKNLCDDNNFWTRLWRTNFGVNIPITGDIKKVYFRRRNIVRLINKFITDKAFLSLDWVDGKSKSELVHLLYILPILPKDSFSYKIYCDLMTLIIKENDVTAFKVLFEDVPMKRNFEEMVNLNRGRMIDVLFKKLSPTNIKLTISGFPISLIYSAVSAEIPCDSEIFKHINVENIKNDQDKEKILIQGIRDNCKDLINKLIPLIQPEHYGVPLIEAVIVDDRELVKKLWNPKISLEMALYYAKSMDMIKFLYSLDKYIDGNMALVSHIKSKNPEIFLFLLSRIKNLKPDTIRPALTELLNSNLPEKEKRERFQLFVDRLFEFKIRNISSKLIFNLIDIQIDRNNKEEDNRKYYLEYILKKVENPKEVNLTRYINLAINNSLNETFSILLNFAKIHNINLNKISIVNTYPSPFKEKLKDYATNTRISP